jgi:glycosyltransferase involved in cell wall biosynthesis
MDKTVDRPFPKITIVTPSFNHGQFIEQTIKSIIDQGYPNLEYFVIDGGSTDGTVSILEKYDEYINFWTSAPDKGQAAAINKGFAMASGEILAWLNSDDTYEPGVLAAVGKAFQENPNFDVVSGRCCIWYGDNRNKLVAPSPLRSFDDFLKIKTNWMSGRLIVQPEAFFRRRAFEKVGRIREEFFYCFDTCMWMDMAKKGCSFHSIDQHWANLRIHKAQKIQNIAGSLEELVRLTRTQLMENWTVVEDPLRVTEDIFSAIDVLLTIERDAAKTLRESKSYRIGRSITNTLRLLIPSDALWGLPSRSPHDKQNGVPSGG